MRPSLVLCLALMAAAAPAAAEDWREVPGEPGTFTDRDFAKVDQTTGLVIVRTTIVKPPAAGYASMPEDSRPPISVSALDCKSGAYKDLGLDFEGAETLPADWRSRPSQPGAEWAVGEAGANACKMRDSLPVIALP